MAFKQRRETESLAKHPRRLYWSLLACGVLLLFPPRDFMGVVLSAAAWVSCTGFLILALRGRPFTPVLSPALAVGALHVLGPTSILVPRFGAWFVAVAVCTELALRVLAHAGHWALEGHQLEASTRVSLRRAFRLSLFFPLAFVRTAPDADEPNNQSDEDGDDVPKRAIPPRIPSPLLALAGVATLCSLADPVWQLAVGLTPYDTTASAYALAALTGGLAVFSALWVFLGTGELRRPVALVAQALANWLTYTEGEEPSPFIHRGRSGPRWYRQLITVLVLMLLVSATGALCGYFMSPLWPGDPSTGLVRMLVAAALCVLVPASAMFALMLAVMGRSLVILERAIDVAGTEFPTEFDGIVARLHSSDNPEERQAIWWGTQEDTGEPVLIPRHLFNQHAYVFGSTGSGKTSRGLAPTIIQVIRMMKKERKRHERPNGTVILDIKGDMALFETTRLECEKAGVPFKWFTNLANRSTYVFNPLMQRQHETTTAEQIGEGLHTALGIDHGEGYGTGYFSGMAREWLKQQFSANPQISSIRELYQLSQEENAFKGDKKRKEAVAELANLLSELQVIPQLNSTDANNAIVMRDVIENDEVAYFFLDPSKDPSGARNTARLAFSALYDACCDRPVASNPQTFLFIDEFQCCATPQFKPVLRQARSKRLALILANQTPDDLDELVLNLFKVVWSQTHFKQCWKTNHEEIDQFLIRSGPEDPRPWLRATLEDGTDGSRRDAPSKSLSGNDIARMNNQPNLCYAQLAHQDQGGPFGNFSGLPIFMETDYAITGPEKDVREGAPWPRGNADTVVDKPVAAAGQAAGAAAESPDEPPQSSPEPSTVNEWGDVTITPDGDRCS